MSEKSLRCRARCTCTEGHTLIASRRMIDRGIRCDECGHLFVLIPDAGVTTLRNPR